jgi:hypothetical protein
VLIPTTGLSSLTFRGQPYTNFGTASAIAGTTYSRVVFPNASIAAATSPNIITANARFQVGVTSNTGGGSTGNYGYYSNYEAKVDVLDPSTSLPVSSYFVANVTPGTAFNHCMNLSRC